MMESIQLAQMLADLSDLNAAQESQAAVALVNANKTLSPSPPAAEPSKASEQPHGPRPGVRHHHRTGSAGSVASGGSSFVSRTASPAKFDRYGRRILTPPNTRTNSAYGSIPGTPRREPEVSRQPPSTSTSSTQVTITLIPPTNITTSTTTTTPFRDICRLLLPSAAAAATSMLNSASRGPRDPQIDEDVDRAGSLMSLYEIRAKLKDQENSRSLDKLREKIAALHARQLQAEKKDAAGGAAGDNSRMRFSYPKTSA